MSPFAVAVLGLILARALAELWLSRLNRQHVRAHANQVPPAFREMIDEPTYRRSVEYTLAKSHFGDIAILWDTALLTALLFSGLLPRWFAWFAKTFGESIWALSGFLFATGVALSLLALPFAWYAQFKLEQRFGFNTATMKTWISDRVKAFLLAALFGYPLLAVVLKLIDWAGTAWWIWAGAVVVLFQLVMALIAPAIILPLFNKFTPLPDGPLRKRLVALAQRVDFPVRNIEVMDGSKRSRHSNAFFIGFGRFRKVVLFDTLIAQLTEPEVESVLAHEIGHYKRRHVPKSLALSVVGVFAGFGAIAWLARQQWFYDAFGFAYQGTFSAATVVPAMLLFGLLAGTITFWVGPLLNMLSRRFEYEADAFARAAMGEAGSIAQALRKLSEKNLSNLTPHPLYSSFFYSHPTLLERERALERSG